MQHQLRFFAKVRGNPEWMLEFGIMSAQQIGHEALRGLVGGQTVGQRQLADSLRCRRQRN